MHFPTVQVNALAALRRRFKLVFFGMGCLSGVGFKTGGTRSKQSGSALSLVLFSYYYASEFLCDAPAIRECALKEYALKRCATGIRVTGIYVAGICVKEIY